MGLVSMRVINKQFTNWRLARKRPYAEIDRAIKPLVDSLNAIDGVVTVASCEGHFFGGTPYVYFKSSMQVAAKIERLLRETASSDQPIFHYDWIIKGLFNEEYELTYCLHSPGQDSHAQNLFRAAWLFVVRRRRVDSDLTALSSVRLKRNP